MMKPQANSVVQLFRNTTEEWYHVHVNGEEIVCTGGHPFYVLNAEADRHKIKYERQPQNAKGAWVCADELKVYDKVLLSDGSCAIIELVEVEKLSEPETTYNFKVADFHTYYVSDSKVLAHNDCKRPHELKDSTSIGRNIQGEGKFGSYDITYSDGKHYIGKGDQNRMWTSAYQHSSETRSVEFVEWQSAVSAREAFIDEAKRMQEASKKGIELLNKIASPGFKYMGEKWIR